VYLRRLRAGVKDVVPQATEDGYEGFEEMIERTNTWLKDQCDILVVNMQSIMVQKDDDGTTTHRCNHSAPDREAEYCDVRMCVCVSVCLSAIISSELHVRSSPRFCACYLRP